jgi:hypothetical protein
MVDDIIMRIYDSERKPFKISFAFGFILEIRTEGELEYKPIIAHEREDHQVITQTVKDSDVDPFKPVNFGPARRSFDGTGQLTGQCKG